MSTQKITPAQIRFVTAVADGHAAPQNVVGSWQPINAAMANKWVEQYRADDRGHVAYRILPAGLEAIGRHAEAEADEALVPTWERALRTVAGALKAEREQKVASNGQAVTLTEPMVAALESAAVTGTISEATGTIKALVRRGLAVKGRTWRHQITAAGWELLPADMRCRAVAIAHKDALAEAYRRIPTGPCVVCGEPDAQSFGGEPECTPCAKVVNAEMRHGRPVSVAEARQRAMRALALGTEMAREMALRMWGRCHAGRGLDAVAEAFNAGDYRRAYELAAAIVAAQDAEEMIRLGRLEAEAVALDASGRYPQWVRSAAAAAASIERVADIETAHAEALEAEAGLRPKYTPGTRQYREYMAALKAELAKWVAGEAPYERTDLTMTHEHRALHEVATCSCQRY